MNFKKPYLIFIFIHLISCHKDSLKNKKYNTTPYYYYSNINDYLNTTTTLKNIPSNFILNR